MTLDFFVKNYDLKDLTIQALDYQNNSLYVTFAWNIEMNYIANGCRPEFDYDVKHLFIFQNQKETSLINSECFVKDYTYDNGILTLILNNQTIKIIRCEIKVVSNI